MKVEYKIPKRNYNGNDTDLTVIFDNNPNIIRNADRYGKLTEEEAMQYVDILHKGRGLTPKEYDDNVDIMHFIYKEMITQKNLKKAILNFPKDCRGYFKRRGYVVVGKSRNVILDESSHGYQGMELRFKFINYKTIELEYSKAWIIT